MMMRLALVMAVLSVFVAEASQPLFVEINGHGQAAQGKLGSEIEQKSLVRSEDLANLVADGDDDPYKYTGAGKDIAPAGVVEGACANFRKTSSGVPSVSVSCPSPLKMTGCSCRDKAGENSGSCGTMFGNLETCNAYTKTGRGITAYVRCCHIGEYTNDYKVVTSEASEAEDGKSVEAHCPSGTDLLGCACQPVDAPNNGCKHNIVIGNDTTGAGCRATNLALDNHKMGVKSQALCANISRADFWETVQNPTFVTDVSTNLSCSTRSPPLHMLSCSCGSDFGNCNGGKVLGNKCECFGQRCFASARCADIPVPPQDCHFNNWGEWSECSSECHVGKTTRVREVAMLATCNDATPVACGSHCDGIMEQEANCSGMLTNAECNVTIVKVYPEEHKFNMMIIYVGGGIVVLLIILGVAFKLYQDSYLKRRGDGENHDEWGGEGEEHYGEGEGGGWEGDGNW